MKLELYSPVKGGKLAPSKTKEIVKYLQALEGKQVRVIVQKASSKRSDQQNRYLHLLFTILKDSLNDLGNDFKMDEVKELCKAKFALMDVVYELTGEIIGQRIKGTSEMSKTELGEFIDRIIIWAADTFGIVLPYPNEILKLEL